MSKDIGPKGGGGEGEDFIVEWGSKALFSFNYIRCLKSAAQLQSSFNPKTTHYLDNFLTHIGIKKIIIMVLFWSLFLFDVSCVTS